MGYHLVLSVGGRTMRAVRFGRLRHGRLAGEVCFYTSLGESLLDDLGDLGDLIDADEGIDLRQEFGQLLAKALGQTAGNDEALAWIAGLAQFGGLEDGIDAFLLSGIDKGTGVDDQNVGLAGIVGDFQTVLEE